MSPQRTEVEHLVVGAGLCGLSAAYHLAKAGDESYLVVEREHEVGGLARTETFDGFSFDHSIHILYTADPYAAALIAEDLLEGNIVRQQRSSWCYSHGVFTEYPYQINNHGLPAEVILENIMGLIEAHQNQDAAPPSNYEEWIYRTFGRGLAENFMIPYNRRQWAWDLTQMNYDWVADRVPMPKLEEVILGALRPPDRRFGPNKEFWYPKEGGIESLARALAAKVGMEKIILGRSVVSIDAEAKEATFDDGAIVSYGNMISTIPLPVLVQLMAHTASDQMRDLARSLHNNIVHTVDLGLVGDELYLPEPMHWIYFPSPDTIFHRISFPHEFSAWMAPEGCSSIQVEISSSTYKEVDQDAIVDLTLEGLVKVGMLRPGDARPVSEGGRVKVAEVVTLDPAYIIYELHHGAATANLKGLLSDLSIQTKGRFGEWEYFNMDHAILSGKAAADALVAQQG